MDDKKHPSDPLPLNLAARCVRVPAKWLRTEAEAGRLPHIRAGSALLFDPEAVERIVFERLRQADGKGASRGNARVFSEDTVELIASELDAPVDSQSQAEVGGACDGK